MMRALRRLIFGKKGREGKSAYECRGRRYESIMDVEMAKKGGESYICIDGHWHRRSDYPQVWEDPKLDG